jgi:hypothetical protein
LAIGLVSARTARRRTRGPVRPASSARRTLDVCMFMFGESSWIGGIRSLARAGQPCVRRATRREQAPHLPG